jgi:hypothetical protein
MILSYPNLQKSANFWITQLSTAINNPPSTTFIPSNLPDGRLKVSNGALSPNAGGLVTYKLQPQNIPNLTYAMLSTIITVPSTSVFNLHNLETDFIQVLTPATGGVEIPNEYNGSTRWNGDTGLFEVDASAGAPQWKSIGAGPGKSLPPDVPHLLIVKYQYDLVKLTTTIISIQWDAVVYPVGTTTGVQMSTWGTVLAIQKQNAAIQIGSTEVIYDQTTLSLSDQPL